MYLKKTAPIENIGFVSTRFKGTDGVSMETRKWHSVLEKMGHECYFFSGLSDWDDSHSMVVEEAFFGHPRVVEIQNRCFGSIVRDEGLTGEIQAVRFRLKRALYEFVEQFKIDLLIVENALTIPMHIPLGLAITEFVAETGIPVIAHHHDFVWERHALHRERGRGLPFDGLSATAPYNQSCGHQFRRPTPTILSLRLVVHHHPERIRLPHRASARG
jgi:hypothetical protein